VFLCSVSVCMCVVRVMCDCVCVHVRSVREWFCVFCECTCVQVHFRVFCLSSLFTLAALLLSVVARFSVIGAWFTGKKPDITPEACTMMFGARLLLTHPHTNPQTHIHTTTDARNTRTHTRYTPLQTHTRAYSVALRNHTHTHAQMHPHADTRELILALRNHTRAQCTHK